MAPLIKALALLTNILDCEGLPGTNALGYLIASTKSFITLALDYL
jgi:hypothetical protein